MALDLLIVDDSVTVRKVLERLVRQAGLPVGNILEAADGREALRALQQHPADLLLTGINMPNMSGLDLLRRLKSDPGLRHIPVIIISTETGQSTVRQAVELGAAGFIRKPFTSDQIREKLAAFC